MKKQIFTFIAISLLLASCNIGGSDSPNNVNTTKPVTEPPKEPVIEPITTFVGTWGLKEGGGESILTLTNTSFKLDHYYIPMEGTLEVIDAKPNTVKLNTTHVYYQGTKMEREAFLAAIAIVSPGQEIAFEGLAFINEEVEWSITSNKLYITRTKITAPVKEFIYTKK